jgi:hypothetical protein
VFHISYPENNDRDGTPLGWEDVDAVLQISLFAGINGWELSKKCLFD